MSAYLKIIWESHIKDFDFTTWEDNYDVRTDYFICSKRLEGKRLKLNFMGEFHEALNRYPIPLIAAFGSRLAEIGVRATYFVMTSVATLLFEELENRLEKQAEYLTIATTFNEKQISKDLDQWKLEYDLLVLFVEQISCCFNFVLLLMTATDFIIPLVEFHNIQFFHYSNPRPYFKCIHGLLRAFFTFAASNNIELKVDNEFICLLAK